MHGAGGGRPPETGKFIPPSQIADAFNALINDPALLSLAFNVGISEARTYELLNMINDNDIRAQAGDISVMLNELLNAVYACTEIMEKAKVADEDSTYLKKTARVIIESLAPEVTAQKLWRQVNNQLEVTRRLNDTERKWIDQHDQMVPMSQVIEAMSVLIRMALKYIEATQDRAAFAQDMRMLVPGMN